MRALRVESPRASCRPPAFEPAAYSASIRAQAASGWQRLHDDERDSVVAATLVATDLARLGAPSELLEAAARVIEDEVRHVNVCESVLRALGRTPSVQQPHTMRSSLGDGDIAERAARALIAGFGVGEALSAASFARARSLATEPLARWAYTELLRDEARHGPFGMRAGEWVLRGWAADRRATIWSACVLEMQEMERRLGGPLDDALRARERRIEGLDELERLGVIRKSASLEAVLAAIPKWVMPRLVSLRVAPMSRTRTSELATRLAAMMD